MVLQGKLSLCKDDSYGVKIYICILKIFVRWLGILETKVGLGVGSIMAKNKVMVFELIANHLFLVLRILYYVDSLYFPFTIHIKSGVY